MLGGCESTDVPHGNERPPDGATITLVQENNYTANATFNIPSVDTPISDLTFTWDAVTANVLCEPVIPSTDVGSAWVIRVEGRDQMGVRELIESFSLASAIDLIAGVPTSGRATTQAQLSEMTLSGATAPLGAQVSDFYLPSSAETPYTYMLLFTAGADADRDAISMTFLNPTGTGEAVVAGQAGCDPTTFQPTLLTYTPVLGLPVPVPAAGPWVVDWYGVKLDSQLDNVSFGKLDRLALAFHENKVPGDFNQQANFFKLESDATLLYEAILPMEKRTGADLATAVLTHDASGQTPDGTPFAGFNNGLTGVWVMAVMCDSCSNPSPVILSVLQPTG